MTIIAILAGGSILFMLFERGGMASNPAFSFKGDVKRETRFLAQYGQLICTFITALLVWQIDAKRGWQICKALWLAVISATFVAMILKRLVGRVRPGRPQAGRFLGPEFRHANFRESFPSSHSASAVAFSVVLAYAYPQAAVTFWVLALICAGLRYVMDAHWPSDVLAGIALGYLAAVLSWRHFFQP